MSGYILKLVNWSLQWVPENKHALGFQGETIAVASQAVLDEPLRLKNAI